MEHIGDAAPFSSTVWSLPTVVPPRSSNCLLPRVHVPTSAGLRNCVKKPTSAFRYGHRRALIAFLSVQPFGNFRLRIDVPLLSRSLALAPTDGSVDHWHPSIERLPISRTTPHNTEGPGQSYQRSFSSTILLKVFNKILGGFSYSPAQLSPTALRRPCRLKRIAPVSFRSQSRGPQTEIRAEGKYITP